MGVERKNTALSLLFYTSNEKHPKPEEVKDLKVSMSEEALSFKDLIAVTKSTSRAEFGAIAAQEKAPLAAEAKAARESAKAQRIDDISKYRMISMNETMSNSNNATRITYFGLDIQYTTTEGLDKGKKEQVPPDQKEMYDRIEKILGVSSETSELGRGGLGGLTALSSIAFMSAHPEVSFVDAMDPNAFVAEKREAAKRVLDALEKANNQDPRDMKPLGELVGEGMDFMMKRDMKKDMLIYLGKDPNLSPEDKLRACYLHACIRYVQEEYLTNSSLRERFGVPQSSAGSISRLIKDAVSQKLIKPLDPDTSNKYMKYVPIWA